mgnify:CR=1 FL=1
MNPGPIIAANRAFGRRCRDLEQRTDQELNAIEQKARAQYPIGRIAKVLLSTGLNVGIGLYFPRDLPYSDAVHLGSFALGTGYTVVQSILATLEGVTIQYCRELREKRAGQQPQ